MRIMNFARVPALAALLIAVSLFLLACGSSEPTATPPPAVNVEDVRQTVQEAVAASATESVSPEEIRAMVEAAVAESAPQGLTAEEIEAQVAKAVSDALAQSGAIAMAPEDETSPFTVTDVAGRTVTIQPPVERIILGEARQIYIVASLQPGNPFDKIIGWRDDLRRFDVYTYEKYK